jgi:galactose mutarotase-like enzyme
LATVPETFYADPDGEAETLNLIDTDTGAAVEIVPQRGGIVSKFDVGEQRVLYMDDATLADPTKNVRGGIPVLFPTPGKLTGDAWSYAGKRGTLKQHGFARVEPWKLTGELGGAIAVAAATLVHEADAAWPWKCALQIAYTLRGRTLRIDTRVDNRGDEAMPCGVGFHPYFYVPAAEKARARVATKATRAFDNVTKREIELRESMIDLTASEVDLHLLDHGRTACELTWPGGEIRLRGSAEYTHWVVWTVAGRDFVCVEPWTCPGNAINSGDRVIVVPPNDARSTWMEIERVM